MRKFCSDLTKALSRICPAFLQVPPEAPYPYITVEPQTSLQGLPWGPTLATLKVKIWSRYAGTQEILKMARKAEQIFYIQQQGSLKIMQSALTLLTDKQTRVHTFSLKARIPSHE
jgi:hypothetical protein